MEIGEVNKINKEYYERNAKGYEMSSWYFFNTYKDTCVNNEIKECLNRINKPEIKILEIGPGTGYLLSKIIKHGKNKIDYLGADHSQEMTAVLTDRYKEKVNRMRTHVNSINSKTVDLITEKFDMIIGSSILHHLPDYESVINKLADKTEDGGILYFVREPLGAADCKLSNTVKDILEKIYRNIDFMLLKPFFKKLLWPQKIKQESSKEIAPVMYSKGVSLDIFKKLSEKRFSIISLRTYNRRASSFFSFMENKWLESLRKDIFGNTLFSITLQKTGGKPIDTI